MWAGRSYGREVEVCRVEGTLEVAATVEGSDVRRATARRRGDVATSRDERLR